MSTPVNRLYNFVTDKNNGVPITASRMDAELDQDITALNQKMVIQSTAPTSPIAGMYWYDSSNKQLKVYRNNEWVVKEGAHVGTSAPSTSQTGDIWFDTTNSLLKIYTGAAYVTYGFNPATPPAIGGTTPAAGSFTTLTLSQIFKPAKGADVASVAGTMTLGDDGNYFDITGTNAITSITAKAAGTIVVLQFDSTASLVDGSNLKLNGNFTGAAESQIALISDGTNWFEICRNNQQFLFVPTDIQVFSSSGTWTKPSNVSKVYVKVWGAGGGGPGTSSGSPNALGAGGAGGYSEGYVAVTGNVTVTIGSGGSGGSSGGGAGGNGGTSSFAGSTTIQATGGSGAAFGTTGANGGVGSNGQINLSGNKGEDGGSESGQGGSSFGFVSDAYRVPPPGAGSTVGRTATQPGCGGSGSARSSGGGNTGGAGANGLIIVYY